MSIKNRFIANCDVLGFRGLVLKNNDEQVKDKYNELLELSSGLTNNRTLFRINLKTNEHKTINYSIEYAIYSDTLLFWLDDDSEIGLGPLLTILSTLILSSIKIEMPLRIGISYGECWIEKDKGIYVGKPIVYAYETEQAQEWIGGSFHKSCLNSARSLCG